MAGPGSTTPARTIVPTNLFEALLKRRTLLRVEEERWQHAHVNSARVCSLRHFWTFPVGKRSVENKSEDFQLWRVAHVLLVPRGTSRVPLAGTRSTGALLPLSSLAWISNSISSFVPLICCLKRESDRRGEGGVVPPHWGRGS